MHETEFTAEFRAFVMDTFFRHEPMNHFLKTQIPDELDLPWLEQVLHKAKDDRLSLGIYDSNAEHSLPVAYALNHHDKKDDETHSDVLYTSSKPRLEHKHEHISGILTKLHDDVDLFERFHCDDLFHVYLLGVDPAYRQQKLAGELIDRSIRLAEERHLPLIYADVTGDYSLNAFLKHGFALLKSVPYASYENFAGERTFEGLTSHHGCSLVFKALRNK